MDFWSSYMTSRASGDELGSNLLEHELSAGQSSSDGSQSTAPSHNIYRNIDKKATKLEREKLHTYPSEAATSRSSGLMRVESKDSTSSYDEKTLTKASKPKRTDHLFKSRYRRPEHEEFIRKAEYLAYQPMVTYVPHGLLPSRESSIVLVTFVDRMIKLTNLADGQELVKLINSCLNENARVRIRSPLVRLDKPGSMIVVGMNLSLTELFPDGILGLKSIKRYRTPQGIRKIKTKIQFSGTRIRKVIPDIFDEETKLKGDQKMIADEVDDDTPENIKEAIRSTEMEYTKNGRMITVGYEITVQMYIDDFSHKVGVYDIESHMVTFAGKALSEYSESCLTS